MLLALGVLAAHIEARQSGEGQVVDAAMVDGANLLMPAIYGLKAAGTWEGGRGNNVLDGGAPWSSVYATAEDRKSVGEGKSVSVSADLGGRRILKQKKNDKTTPSQ